MFPTEAPPLHAYVIDLTGGESAVLLTAELRRAGFRVDRGFDDRSMKSQMKSADRSGALVALMIGPKELAEGTVSLKPAPQRRRAAYGGSSRHRGRIACVAVLNTAPGIPEFRQFDSSTGTAPRCR